MLPPKADWSRSIYPASRLDEYLAYLSGEMWNGDEYTAEEFVNRMTTYEPTPAMEAGTAVHEVIEHASFGDLPTYARQRGWSIYLELDAEVRIPAMREVPLCREYNGITMVGRCDAMDACTVHDIKTTSQIDVDRYLDSYQWRSYLWMTGCSTFIYDVFRVQVDEQERSVYVREYVPIKLNAYPGMGRDVETLIEGFDACVKSLGIGEIMARRKVA